MSEENISVVSDITNTSYSEGAAAVFIQMRRKSSSEWGSSTYVPKIGEPCFESDSYRYKIGDGIHTWANLSYAICAVDDGELA